MIRYAYIYNQVLQIYKTMEHIAFPIDPCNIISTYENCRSMTYGQFAEINRCPIRDVILLSESKSGCTHYDVTNDRYLILWNEDNSDNNVPGRKRWTKAHELGHVVLKHLPPLAEPHLEENGFNNLTAPELEIEADQFSATLLCPIPLFDLLHISSPADIQTVFGLSTEASNNRWQEFQQWKKHHKKTAWENDMKRVFQNKLRHS